jgi:hypothetical protein
MASQLQDQAFQGRRFDGRRLVIASHNSGKVREINDLLMPLAIEVVSADTLGLPSVASTNSLISPCCPGPVLDYNGLTSA